jgi:tRNA nucleotidyltransferase (CCA-adding enzyme)
MTKPPKVIDSDRPMADAAELMTRFGLKSVAVVMPGTMRCVGLLDQRTADKAVGHGLKSVPLAEYMVTDFTTAAPTATLHQVMEIVIGKRQRFLPVVENGMIIGVITRTDLVNLLVEESARIPEPLLPDPQADATQKRLCARGSPVSSSPVEQGGMLAKELGYQVYAVRRIRARTFSRAAELRYRYLWWKGSASLCTHCPRGRRRQGAPEFRLR